MRDSPDAAALTSAPIEDYLDALATAPQSPPLAIGACLLRLNEAAPPLRALVLRAAQGEVLGDDEVTLLWRGLHVLGGGRDTEAFGPVLRLLRLPGDDLEYLLGDVITETLPGIIAGVFDGDAETLFGAIADNAIDEWARDALLSAATFLTWKGRIEPARMSRFLIDFHERRLAPDGDQAWIAWVNAITLLGLELFAPKVKAAWAEGMISRDVMDLDDFRSDLDEALRRPDDCERFARANLGYIDDVLAALARWDKAADAWSEPAVNPWRGVGRNDPCPCGSGRKFKKCCIERVGC